MDVYCGCGDSIFEGDYSGLLCVNCACMKTNENDNFRERTHAVRERAKDVFACGENDAYEKGYNQAMRDVVKMLDGDI